jgi:hypothetical protein
MKIIALVSMALATNSAVAMYMLVGSDYTIMPYGMADQCLCAPSLRRRKKIELKACDYSAITENSEWMYMEDKGCIKSYNKNLCWSAKSTGSKIKLKKCDENDASQLWDYDYSTYMITMRGQTNSYCVSATYGKKVRYGRCAVSTWGPDYSGMHGDMGGDMGGQEPTPPPDSCTKDCWNAATCMEAADGEGEWCKCPPGGYGELCDNFLSGSSCGGGGNCSNHGDCVEIFTNSFTCHCHDGYVGWGCEGNYILSSCNANTCLFGGSCNAAGNGCNCVNNWYGAHCEFI